MEISRCGDVEVSTSTHLLWLDLLSMFSFAECSLFYVALLQKRPLILRSLLIVATPYRDIEMSRCRVQRIYCGWQNMVSFIGLFCKRDL